MATAYVGLGSNLGDRVATLREAVRRLAGLGRLAAVSSLYETAPVGYLEQPLFLNAAVALETELTPVALLHELLQIERDLGRVRTFRNAPRTLDLDLLLMDGMVLESADLTLPHPRLSERAFVLVPLAEIAPEAWHPGLAVSAAEMLHALTDRGGVRRLAGQGWEIDMVETD
jgi:2-amino-4-hydroxy-6-hydroxymethyldihydropteridine diphosphokinase